MVTTITHLRF